MARYTNSGPSVTNTNNGYTVTWYCKQVVDITVTATTVNVKINVYAHFVNAAQIFAGYLSSALVIDNNVNKRANPQTDEWPGNDEDWLLITQNVTWTRGTTDATHPISSWVTVASGSSWAGSSSNYNNRLIVTVPKLQTYGVYYNANSGSGAPSSQVKYHGKELTISSVIPTRTGYSFQGWGETSTTSTVRFVPGGKYYDNKAITLYAVWSKNSYTLTYNANEGSVSPTSKSVAYGSSYGSLPTPTRANYNFLGWYTSSSGGTKVTSSTTMGAGNTTIYAHWERAYVAPKLTISEVKRIAANRVEDDAGNYAYIKFVWSDGDNAGTPISPSTYDILINDQTSGQTAISITNRTITSSPIEVYSDEVVSSIIDTESSYIVQVILHVDGQDNVTQTSYISQAYFIMDINKDGTAIGLGGAVQDSDQGLYCYMDANFDNGINIPSGKKYKINGNNLSAADVGAVPTTRTVNGKALSANVADADYVTEIGTSGAWKYRKWNSGKVEAWAYISFTSTTPAVWASPIRYIDKTFTIPSGIFASAPKMTGTSNSNQYWAVDVSASSSTAGNVRFCTVASSALTPYIQIYAWTD